MPEVTANAAAHATRMASVRAIAKHAMSDDSVKSTRVNVLPYGLVSRTEHEDPSLARTRHLKDGFVAIDRYTASQAADPTMAQIHDLAVKGEKASTNFMRSYYMQRIRLATHEFKAMFWK